MLTRATAKVPEKDDLFSEEVTLLFPALLALEGRLLGSAVGQKAVPSALTPCRVCGQAQKSARWRDRPIRMLQHMIKREQKRRDRCLSSRIETASAAAIKELKAGWQDYRFEYDVRIVQPGLSRKAIEEDGLHLLAGVETYLLETRGMRLRVIGSD